MAATGNIKTGRKKKRWRDQKASTVLVKQLDFQTSARDLRKWLGEDETVTDIRLVKDAATRAKTVQRKHAGLAYVVCVDADAAKRVVARVDGAELGGRRLGACLLDDVESADDSGRVDTSKKTKLLAVNAVTALAKRHGLALDSAAVEALRSSPHAIVSRALADTAKAPAANNQSAYLLGVLKRLKRESHDAPSEDPPRLDERPKLLSVEDVDRVVDAAVSRANGGFARADIDKRARDYLGGFSEKDATHALSLVADLVSSRAKVNGRLVPKKKHLQEKVASPSAFLMGILRDMRSKRKGGGASASSRKKSHATTKTTTTAPVSGKKRPATAAAGRPRRKSSKFRKTSSGGGDFSSAPPPTRREPSVTL